MALEGKAKGLVKNILGHPHGGERQNNALVQSRAALCSTQLAWWDGQEGSFFFHERQMSDIFCFFFHEQRQMSDILLFVES